MTRPTTRASRLNLSLTRPIVALSVGVLVPVILSTATGIVAITVGESSTTLILGILVVSFMAAAIGGAVILYVLLGRRVRIARLQSDLLANVTHDLRTPLTVIRVHAQTLESGILDDDPARSRASLATIVRETEWLEAMIDRVISWRAASRDRSMLVFQVAPVGPVVEDTAARFLRMVPPDEVAFLLDLSSIAPVRHDPLAMEQALLNLLVNAYKYSSGRERRISVTARDIGRTVVITVEDNGVGIPGAERERIFEPFHRAVSPSSGVAGAGLGLAIVRHLIEAHGGTVEVESEVGRGSRFTVILPQASEGEMADAG